MHDASFGVVITGSAGDDTLIVFDLDGTLRRCLVAGRSAPHSPDEWELLPGVKATIARVREAHPRVRFGVASNQDDVGKGKISFDMARTLARRAVAAAGIPEADIELCPHTPEERCACRKPSPVMIERLRGRAPNARRTLVVGNALLDVLTARHARAPFISGARFFRRTPAGPVEFIDIAAHAAPQIRASHSG